MKGLQVLKAALVCGASVLTLVSPTVAREFDIPNGELSAALDAYMHQSGVRLIYTDDVHGHTSRGARGEYTDIAALTQLLRGTGFTQQPVSSSAFGIVSQPAEPVRVAQVEKKPAAPSAASSVETVVVTAQKKSEDIQQVPIAITALSQQQLTERQIAAGPDLVKEVPNLTFSKTNFTGYNLEIRGIGTQAISATTDPAVAVAFNGTPFIRNHFFEQEFFDVGDLEVLRGPQGTLYGRNSTAGVVNIGSALPTDQYEAMLSADFGNYSSKRYEGMLNLPVEGDKLDIRIAGEWTKRDGYSFDTTTNEPIDGRDLWSTRMTIGWKPVSDVQAYLVWEHFSEDDNRLRSSKQLCETDPGPTSINGVPVAAPNVAGSGVFQLTSASFSQGCLPTSMYSKSAFEVPNGYALPFVAGAEFEGILNNTIDPYASTTQSTNLRDIQSAISPTYIAKNDTLELNADWQISPELTLTSQTGYNHDYLFASEDYNRFDTSPGVFVPGEGSSGGSISSPIPPSGIFCDPQLGCSDRLVVQDLSTETSWQASQEFRLASNYKGPLNFSLGANYLHYETVEDYYVFANTFTLISLNEVGCTKAYVPNVTTNAYCLLNGFSYTNPSKGGGIPTESPEYIDPNPLRSVNNEGHNYFLSQNPYVLNSYAIFGETYYDLGHDLRLTAGARWTDDQKHFVEIPSWLLSTGWGYPVTGSENQKWDRWTGRFVADWTPDLDFTDKTLIYASYAHGYKAGGANPPGPVFASYTYNDPAVVFPTHPLTFKPEYIEAFELGTKNTALDGALTINADIFYYNYTGYQISQIVDRSALNLNFNAHVDGAELEANYEPIPGLKFSFAGGYEDTALAGGSYAIDLMNRTQSNPNWILMRPFVTDSSNCIFPTYVAAALVQAYAGNGEGNPATSSCSAAYQEHLDPVTLLPYAPNPTVSNGGSIPLGYPGYNPATAPNDGQGFAKNISGNALPGAPHFTTSLTAEYTMPVSANWAATLHADFYWQSQQWSRVENDNPFDKIHGYSTTNLSLILTSGDGWQIMGYVKNLFNVTAITGTFLNSDDSGLTNNTFLTDPRLYGIRLTKHFGEAGPDDGIFGGIPDLFANSDGGAPPLWIEFGGQLQMLSGGQQPFLPPFASEIPSTLTSWLHDQAQPRFGFDQDVKLSFQPEGTDWVAAAEIRFGRSVVNKFAHKSLPPGKLINGFFSPPVTNAAYVNEFETDTTQESGKHEIMDFTIGKDVGLGMFGLSGSSVLSVGARAVQLDSRSSTDINTDPNVHSIIEPPFTNPPYHDNFNASQAVNRDFRGIGPTIKWDASTPILDGAAFGTLMLDWGANGAILFGRRKVAGQHQTSGCRLQGTGSLNFCATYDAQYTHAGSLKRSRAAVVPNLGAYAALSVRYSNARVSFGYRADMFFGAIDGGQASPKAYDRGFFGPYAHVSIGLGEGL